MKKLLTKERIILISIFIISFLLRIIFLGKLPYNLMEDEILSGYVGRFILQNGKDLYGNVWPLLYFDKFGDYYIIGPMYLSGLSTYLFGITSFAVRFPSAFFGSLVVFLIYYLTKYIFRKKEIAYLAAFFIAITPFHVTMSRSTSEGIIGTTFFLTALVFLIKFVYSKKISLGFIGYFLMLVTYFIYHPFRIYSPVLSLLILIIFFNNLLKNKKKFILSFCATVLFLSLTFYISQTPWGKGRFEQTSIFGGLARVQGAQQEQIFNMGGKRVFEARLYHNKVLGYGREFASQYFSYFDPQLLFTDGATESRYYVPFQGLFYISFAVFAMLAAICIKNKNLKINKKVALFSILFFLFSLFPAALTYSSQANIHRSVFTYTFMTIVFALGAYKVYVFNKKIIYFFALPILLFEFSYFINQYAYQADVFTASSRNDGQREVIEYIKENEDKYEKIYLPLEGTFTIYNLFYTKNFDPTLAGKFGSDVKLDKIGKIVFTETSCPSVDIDIVDSNVLMINKSTCVIPEKFQEVALIQGKNKLIGYKLSKN